MKSFGLFLNFPGKFLDGWIEVFMAVISKRYKSRVWLADLLPTLWLPNPLSHWGKSLFSFFKAKFFKFYVKIQHISQLFWILLLVLNMRFPAAKDVSTFLNIKFLEQDHLSCLLRTYTKDLQTLNETSSKQNYLTSKK